MSPAAPEETVERPPPESLEAPDLPDYGMVHPKPEEDDVFCMITLNLGKFPQRVRLPDTKGNLGDFSRFPLFGWISEGLSLAPTMAPSIF